MGVWHLNEGDRGTLKFISMRIVLARTSQPSQRITLTIAKSLKTSMQDHNTRNHDAMKPQFVTDNNGKRIAVILPIKAYNKLIKELEDLEDVRLYDEAKKEDTGERILFSDYLKNRKAKNAKIHPPVVQKGAKATK
jgi:hypothetical protein